MFRKSLMRLGVEPCRMYRAPWSHGYRRQTFYCLGTHAHEVQLGSVVLQLFYEPFPHARFCGHRFHVWKA